MGKYGQEGWRADPAEQRSTVRTGTQRNGQSRPAQYSLPMVVENVPTRTRNDIHAHKKSALRLFVFSQYYVSPLCRENALNG